MMITAMWWAGTGFALLIGLAIGFLIENATHQHVGRHCPVCQAHRRGAPSDERDPAPPPSGDGILAPLSLYDTSRIAMLDELNPARLLDLAIFLSGRHPESVDEGLALLAPIGEDPGA
jgi:hypothetical protein